MQFTRLRLSGFKSFIDPTELLIEPGLTGVVGPNGCGKSNLLEGMRWAMGENSAKSLRGSGMDDIIFSGTDSRPARNLADVTLFLDNSKRTAPAAFNDTDELEVSRRIERESGSAYRINGLEVRAKDVQLLFADAATGAHSPALVSQGRVGELISAKPQNRRAILEEAAGISGLHSRRKEAESRLRSADNNLLRLDDVLLQMEDQRTSLKRQARQATRYKNISGDIRRAEALLLYLKWLAVSKQVLEAENRLTEAHKATAKLTESVASLTTREAELAADLPEMRQAEAEAGAGLHRLNVARENLRQEEERVERRKEELQTLLAQILEDKTRERGNIADARLALKRIESERSALEGKADKATEEQAANELQEAHRKASKAESAHDELSAKLAREQVRRENLEQDSASLSRRLKSLDEELERITNELLAADKDDGAAATIRAAGEAVKAAENKRTESEGVVETSEAERLRAIEVRDSARQQHSEARSQISGMEAETRGLNDLLQRAAAGDGVAISEALSVKKGFETALGAALGDDLEAPEAEDRPLGWRLLPPLEPTQPLPDGVAPLSDFVSGSKALERRLSQTGLVSAEQGQMLADKLRPGQRLVSKEGALWRWDGFQRQAEVPTPAAIRLAQRNRLQDLEAEKAKAEAGVAKLAAAMQNAEDSFDEACEAERQARKDRAAAEETLETVRRGLSEAERQTSDRTRKLAAMEEAQNRITSDRIDIRARLKRMAKEQKGLPEPGEGQTELENARTIMEGLRSNLAAARAKYDGLRQMKTERGERLGALNRDHEAWQSRLDGSGQQEKELDGREQEARRMIDAMNESPEEAEKKRQALMDQIEKAERQRKTQADRLAARENAVGEIGRELKTGQNLLSEAREARARVEAAFEADEARQFELGQAIEEKFQCPPGELRQETGLKPEAEPPELEGVDRRLQRLRAERERLGAVNLRADIELQELSEQVEHLTSERQDLEAAIARLRQGINSLNREGRERMLAAFEEVNRHFGELFGKLFAGGEAHLALIDSDDPLDAGLEIMASPPGKKLQTLSLLSGGEQALTAISLIFAVFMTNPAPICVLDEVDAPLDDANVERFCNLLDDIVARTDTRFMIVTHNAVTMARMDRLFGVTMSERGVSQLVSVDLEKAEEIRAVS